MLNFVRDDALLQLHANDYYLHIGKYFRDLSDLLLKSLHNNFWEVGSYLLKMIKTLGTTKNSLWEMPSIGFWPSKVLNRKILWQLVWLLKVTTAAIAASQTRKKGNLPLRLLRLMRGCPGGLCTACAVCAPQHFMINFNAKRLIGLLPLSSNYNIVLGNHLKVSFYLKEYFQSVDVV